MKTSPIRSHSAIYRSEGSSSSSSNLVVGSSTLVKKHLNAFMQSVGNIDPYELGVSGDLDGFKPLTESVQQLKLDVFQSKNQEEIKSLIRGGLWFAPVRDLIQAIDKFPYDYSLNMQLGRIASVFADFLVLQCMVKNERLRSNDVEELTGKLSSSIDRLGSMGPRAVDAERRIQVRYQLKYLRAALRSGVDHGKGKNKEFILEHAPKLTRAIVEGAASRSAAPLVGPVFDLCAGIYRYLRPKDSWYLGVWMLTCISADQNVKTSDDLGTIERFFAGYESSSKLSFYISQLFTEVLMNQPAEPLKKRLLQSGSPNLIELSHLQLQRSITIPRTNKKAKVRKVRDKAKDVRFQTLLNLEKLILKEGVLQKQDIVTCSEAIFRRWACEKKKSRTQILAGDIVANLAPKYSVQFKKGLNSLPQKVQKEVDCLQRKSNQKKNQVVGHENTMKNYEKNFLEPLKIKTESPEVEVAETERRIKIEEIETYLESLQDSIKNLEKEQSELDSSIKAVHDDSKYREGVAAKVLETNKWEYFRFGSDEYLSVEKQPSS